MEIRFKLGKLEVSAEMPRSNSCLATTPVRSSPKRRMEARWCSSRLTNV